MRIISNAWRHVRRSPYQAIAAVSIMTLTFIVSGMFFLLSIGSQVILYHFEQKPEIIVFFKDSKSETDILKLETKFKEMPDVASVKYVSKEAALAIYKEQFRDDPLLLEMVSSEILPASIEVSAKKLEQLPVLADLLKQEADISDIIFPEDVVSALVSWTKVIRQIGVGLVVFLGVVSLFTVITVVGMKIALRLEEIDILRLVGATNWYIRLPFLTEGIFYGMSGALLGWGINVGLLMYATPLLSSVLSGIPLFPIPLAFYALFFALMIGAGFVLGSLASILALNRYLKR